MTYQDLTQFIYGYGDYAPTVLVLLCLVLLFGLPGPTVQKPNTWHMTLLIILVFSAVNAFLMPVYHYFMSEQRLIEMGGNINEKQTEAYHAWMMGFAYIRSWLAGLDFFSGILIIAFAQRGQKIMAIVFAAAILANLLTVADILATRVQVYEIPILGFNVLKLTDSVYSEYQSLIFYINLAQIGALLGEFGGWSKRNITYHANAVLAFSRSNHKSVGLHNVFDLVRSHRFDKRMAQ